MKRFIVYLILLFSLLPILSQGLTLPFTGLFWNIENLFDTLNNTTKNDEEFLPHSLRRWNSYKYYTKINLVAKQLIEIGEWSPPILIGLCEVENELVLNHLTKHTALKAINYRFFITESPDPRGINVALLYLRERFKPITHCSIRINPNLNTRDILHVSGVLLTKDTLDVFVCHFPSRAGGTKNSEYKRAIASSTLFTYLDSVSQKRTKFNALIMGDFNATVGSKSLRIKKFDPNQSSVKEQLYQTINYSQYKKYGSYKYRGIWETIDHVFVSPQLLNPNNSILIDSTTIIYSAKLLEEDKKYGGLQPFRTYNGIKYQGGISDHLPLLFKGVEKINRE